MSMNNKRKQKTIVFSLVLAAMSLAATNLAAQNDGSRGLFERGASADYTDRSNSTYNYLVSTQNFGQEAPTTPLGSGIGLLLAAGAGYVALRRKKSSN